MMLEFETLTRWFGEKCAVSSLTLAVRKGQVMGLLGPNGAGKSTSMKMAAGYLRPSSGRITLGGHDVWKAPLEAKEHLGYLPESTPLYPDLICSEYLTYLARLRGIQRKHIRHAVDSVVDACFLEPVRRQAIRTLSKGYRHRLCLAQSLLGDPDILIFDEPTDGLDPNQKQEIRDLINRIAKDKAIVISTHILEEVEAVCTDVFIIHQGNKVFSGTPEELRAVSAERQQIDLHLHGGEPETVIAQLIEEETVQSATLESQDAHGYRVRLALRDETTVGELHSVVARIATAEGATVLGFIPDQGQIGRSFRSLTASS